MPPKTPEIVDLLQDQQRHIQQAAGLLVEGFTDLAPNAWPDLATALKEVGDSFGPDRISRIAVDDSGRVAGWIGGIRHYDGYVWELHPLVVAADCRGRGIGRALVRDLQQRVRERGGITLYAGTDDETNLTSISGIDLYPNVLNHLLNIRNLRRHPFGFYLKVGFEIVGVIPDANGFGKPDIIMAKRVRKA